MLSFVVSKLLKKKTHSTKENENKPGSRAGLRPLIGYPGTHTAQSGHSNRLTGPMALKCSFLHLCAMVAPAATAPGRIFNPSFSCSWGVKSILAHSREARIMGAPSLAQSRHLHESVHGSSISYYVPSRLTFCPDLPGEPPGPCPWLPTLDLGLGGLGQQG